MNTFYNEIFDQFQGHLRDDIIDAIEGACITSAEWAANQQDCIERIYGVLEESMFDDYDGQPDEAQEWYDFNPDC
jgi:hypothetical protein